MQETAPRLAIGVLLLAALWIAVYWWWEPQEQRDGRITFGDHPATVPAVQVSEPDAGELAGPPESPIVDEPIAQEPAPVEATPQPVRAEQPDRRPIAVIPPQFQSYTVKAGDTLRTISMKFFGTTTHAGAIARSNPLMDPERLRAGRVIRVPRDPSNIQGKPAPQPVVADGGKDKPGRASAAGKPPKTYTVRSGDSLSEIAKDLLGSSGKADAIFRANRDKLKDPDDLRVGLVLMIPDEAGSER